MSIDVGTAVGYLDLDTSGFTRGFSRAKSDLNTFLDSTASAQDRIAGLGSAMTNVGSTLTKWVTLPLIGVGTAAMKVGNDFESAMSRVQAISGATGEELEALTDQAMDLGAQTSFSASEAAAGMENLASAGFTVNEIMSAMPGLLDLAASSGADLATASEIAASAVRGFGLSAEDTTHVADVFAEASARTNAQVEDMGEAMKYIAPVANAMGLSLEETAAAVGLLSDAGIKGSQAGTTLRGALSSLAKPTKEAKEVMDTLGLSFYDLEGNMLSLPGIVEQLENGMSGLTQEQRNQALITLFGQESLSGMLTLMDRGSGELSDMAESFENVNGAAKEMAEIMLDNTSGALEELSGSLETAGINIQQILAPAVTSVAEWLTGLVNAFNSMDQGTQTIIVTILGVVAAIGPLLLIFGKVAALISSITGLIGGAGGLSAVFAALTGPIGIVIAAVAALAAAWATDFGGMREKTTEILAALQTLFQMFVATIQYYVVEPLISLLATIVSMWESNWMGIQDAAAMIWQGIEQAFSAFLDIIINVLQLFINIFQGNWSAAWQNIVNIASSIWSALVSLFSSILAALITVLANIAESLWSTAVAVFTRVQEGFQQVWEDIKAWFESAKEDPVNAILGIASSMYDAGRSIINSLWEGLKSAWESVVSWVDDVIGWLTDKLNVNAKVHIDTSSSGSYASGLSYVPRDMYVKVHEGESIRTKQQTREDMNSSKGGDTYNFYSPEPIDELEAAKQLKRAKRDLAEGF